MLDCEFLEKLHQLEGLIWYAAKRFEIPGVLPREDLYQEGLMALDETIEENWSPNDEVFNRSFKSRLWHRMSERLRFYKTQGRDYTKEIRAEVHDIENEEISILDRLPQSTYPPPDYGLVVRDFVAFLTMLQSGLKQDALNGRLWGNSSDDAIDVLGVLVDTDVEIPEHMEEDYERCPTRSTHRVLAELLGWDVSKVRRALNKLRSKANEVSGGLSRVNPF